MPDLGVEGDRGILDTYKELMSLGYQNNPVVLIGEKEGKVERETWIEYDEVVVYEHRGHILRDLAVHKYNHKAIGTWIRLKREGSDEAHSQRR